MKQFNLQEYLENPNRKIVTRDGRSVRIHCANYSSEQFIIAEIEGNNYSGLFTKDGKYHNSNGESLNDLFFGPEKKEGWVNLFKINSTITTGEFYNTEEEARSAVKNTAAINSYIYISTVKVEWEE